MWLLVANLKQRLFPDAWRSRCLAMLEAADPLFDDELCWRDVKHEVRKRILLTKGNKAAKFASDELGAANLVLGVIADLCEREVTFGFNHIYRGVLSMSGQSYRTIAEIALNELHENGCVNCDELDDRLERIQQSVKAAG